MNVHTVTGILENMRDVADGYGLSFSVRDIQYRKRKNGPGYRLLTGHIPCIAWGYQAQWIRKHLEEETPVEVTGIGRMSYYRRECKSCKATHLTPSYSITVFVVNWPPSGDVPARGERDDDPFPEEEEIASVGVGVSDESDEDVAVDDWIRDRGRRGEVDPGGEDPT